MTVFVIKIICIFCILQSVISSCGVLLLVGRSVMLNMVINVIVDCLIINLFNLSKCDVEVSIDQISWMCDKQ